MLPMLRAACALLLTLVIASGSWAQSEVDFDRTAACVAALKPKAATLAERYRAGDDTVRNELTGLTEAGFALIGVAYEAGLRKEDADRRLELAEEAQKAMPGAKLDELATACHAEGAAVLARANAVERAVVRHAARGRISRIRDK